MKFVRTVILGGLPSEVEELIMRRRPLGQDLFDEVWDGDYHLAPPLHGRHGRVANDVVIVLQPFARRAGLRGSGPANIGTPNDYRVPDLLYFADSASQTFNPTAEIVVEIRARLAEHDRIL